MGETKEPGISVAGERILPAADPDELEANLAAELDDERARDAVVEATRALLEHMTEIHGVPRSVPPRLVDGEDWPGYWSPSGVMRNTAPLMALSAALERHDAAKAAYPHGTGE